MKLSGISPGETRRSYDGKTYFRDALIAFYKYYNGAEKYSADIKDWELLPELRAFWDEQKKVEGASCGFVKNRFLKTRVFPF